uniref:Uncharacterized protein n=1 Tax=Candidatus Enterococcus clewellii TaxID=1834193 RepID=A0A242KDF4_9ENTE|nr:hypothetical protein A5888_000632 [Enterococcus sp. 9E7_DIV0242]
MNLIDEYEAHLISYEEFQHHLWESGQQLINAVGLETVSYTHLDVS